MNVRLKVIKKLDGVSVRRICALVINCSKRYVGTVIHREYADGYDEPFPVYPASSLGSFQSDLADAPRSVANDRHGFCDERACGNFFWYI